MKLGSMLRAYRGKNRIYQSDMAKRLKCTPSTLSRIESEEHEPYGQLAIDIIDILEPGLKQRLALLNAASEQVIAQNKEWLERFKNGKK